MKKLLFFALAASCAMTVGAQTHDQFVDFGMELQQTEFAVGDIDNDGDLDVIFSGNDGGANERGAIMLNNGDGTFSVQSGERVIKTGKSGNIKFGDIDGDGDLDVIFTGWWAEDQYTSNFNTGIALNDGNGVFTLADETKYPVNKAIKVTACGFADFNNDGLLDYYFFADGKNNKIYLQQADGSFVERVSAFPERNFKEPEVTLVDFDNDGDIDIFVSCWSYDENSRYSRVFYNNNGIFTEDDVKLEQQKANGTTAWGDINGDGYMDFLLNGDDQGMPGPSDIESDYATFLYKNNAGKAEATAVQWWHLGRQNGVGHGSVIVDWNGDGKLDFFEGGWNGTKQKTALFMGDNPEDFTFTESELGDTYFPGISEQSYQVADLNKDGKPELLICGYSGGTLTFNRRICGYVKNNSENALALCAAPENLAATVDGNKVTFSWDAVAGSKIGVTYNLSLYNKTTGKWLYNPMANLETGWRKVGGYLGNVYTNTSYTLTLPNGEYEWTVQAINGQFMGGAFAETKTFTVDAEEPQFALTRTLYFDFGKSDGTNGNQTTGADANGNYWNNIVSTESGSPSTKPAGYMVSNLVDAANQPTGFTLTTTEPFEANGRNNGGLKTPDAALLGDLAVGTATEDYFFIESAMSDKGAFTLSGLDPAKAYRFYIFGSREGTDNRTAVYSISGLNGSHGTLTATGTGGAATNEPRTTWCPRPMAPSWWKWASSVAALPTSTP